MAGMGDANAAVELSLARANRLMLSGVGSTLEMLSLADAELSKRLQGVAKKHGGGNARYTEAHAQLYREQIRAVTGYLTERLAGKTDEQARKAIELSVKQTVDLATRLEERFTGITRPLSIHSQATQDSIVQGTHASRIRQNAASWERYGAVITGKFEAILRAGSLAGMTHHQMISQMVETGKAGGFTAESLHQATPGWFPEPTGYVRERYWAERIVRTETAHALNAASINTMTEMRNTDFPDMQKKILAHFDNRTAQDSVAVHGQIRNLDDYFLDGAGRTYLRPPARPHDRECVIPWRPHWSELESTEAPKAEEVKEAVEEIQGKEAAKARAKSLRTERAEQRQQRRAALAEQVALKATVLRQRRTKPLPPDLTLPLPDVLSTLPDGTPIHPTQMLPRKPLPVTGTAEERAELGAAIRKYSKPGKDMTFTSTVTAHESQKDREYQSRMYAGKDARIDPEAIAGIRKFSYGYDFLIRRYSEGASRPELIAMETAFRKLSVPDQRERADIARKVDAAIRASHELERAFALGEDSPIRTTYRGIGGLSNEKLNELLGSSAFDMGGAPSSTSSQSVVATGFMEGNMTRLKGHGVLLKLERASKGLGIEAVSEMPEEHEVLVHGNSRWQVVRKDRLSDFNGYESWLIEAKEIL